MRGIAMSEHAKPSRGATYQDVLDAPPQMVAEIVRGALHLHPRPAPRHTRASSSLGGALQNPFDQGIGGPGGWWILVEPELHLGEDVLVPDVGGWRRERMPKLPENAFFELAPEWACEVLSPGTRELNVTVKRDVYGANGVAWLWFVDPIARTLEAFAVDAGKWVLIAALREDAEVQVPPFEVISFPLARLWAD